MSGTLRKIGGSSRFFAIAIHKDQVHLAGQVSQINDGDITDQARDVFAKVDALLAEAAIKREDLISLQIWLADMANYEGMNAVWDDWVSTITPPTRICVEARMAQPHYRVEVLRSPQRDRRISQDLTAPPWRAEPARTAYGRSLRHPRSKPQRSVDHGCNVRLPRRAAIEMAWNATSLLTFLTDSCLRTALRQRGWIAEPAMGRDYRLPTTRPLVASEMFPAPRCDSRPDRSAADAP